MKGFQKVFLKAGEQKEILIQLDKNAFQYFNETNMDWATEEGDYEIQVGGSSQLIRLKEKVSM